MNTPRTEQFFTAGAMKDFEKYPAAKFCAQLETELAAMTDKVSEMELYKKAYQETARKYDSACSELSAVNKDLKAEREKVAKLRDAADIGLGYAQECLLSHDVELGRTIERNKRGAESIEADIATIQKALEATK